MTLDSFQKKILVELFKNGYIGNWYNPFGKFFLRVYRAGVNEKDSLVIKFGWEIDITAEFECSIIDHPLRNEKYKTFEKAISIATSMYAEKNS